MLNLLEFRLNNNMLKKIKNKWLRRTIFILLGLILFIIIFAGVVIFLYSQTSILEETAVKYLNSQLAGNGSIKYTSLRGSLLNQIEIENLDVTIPDQAQIKCNYLEVHYDIWKLLYNEI